MNWTPNKWVATILNLVLAPFGFLYLGKWRWALGYFVLVILVGAAALANLTPYEAQGLLAVFGALAAYQLARKAAPLAVRPWYSRWSGIAGLLVALVAFVALVRGFLYEPFAIPSTSMLPTLAPGDKIIARKWGAHTELARGDMVVFRYPIDPSTQHVKRVVGIAGDHVVVERGRLTVNGVAEMVTPLPDLVYKDRSFKRSHVAMRSYAHDIVDSGAMDRPNTPEEGFQSKEACSMDAFRIACTIPPGSYFVLGDNRDNSLDSRHWGLLRADQVLGKVVRVMH